MFTIVNRIDSIYFVFFTAIDATGIGVSPPSLSTVSDRTDKYKNVFLYVMACKGRDKTVTIEQMISQLHTLAFISYWIHNWKQKNKCPDEVVVDDSEALVNACVQNFTSARSTNEYISQCMDCLLSHSPRPSCFIRLDRSHFIRCLFRNKQLSAEDDRKTSLFRAIFGVLIECEDYLEAKEIIIHLFTILLNKFSTEFVLQSLQRLQDICEGKDIADSDDRASVFEENEVSQHENMSQPFMIFSDQDNSYKSTSAYHWLNIAKNSIVIIDRKEKYIDNLYYSPKLERTFILILTRITLWSNIMLNTFDSQNYCPTSSGLESEFKNIKQLLNITKCKRVDLFVKEHLDHLTGSLRTCVSTQKKFQMALEAESNMSYENSQPQESWRNKNEDATPQSILSVPVTQRRSRHSILKRRCISFICKSIHIFKNGHRTGRAKNPIVTENTCAFDSIVSVFACLYADYNDVFTTICNDTASSIINLIAKSFSVKKLGAAIYNKRNDLLHEIYSADRFRNNGNIKVFDNNLTHIDCRITVGGLFEAICQRNEVLATLCQKGNCSYCDGRVSQYLPFLAIDYNLFDMSNIQNSILDNSRKVHCQVCDGHSAVNPKYNSIVAIEVLSLEEERISTKISDISKEISINGDIYQLYAAIEYESNHFRAHVLRRNQEWQTFDNMKSHETCCETNKSILIDVIFYINQKKNDFKDFE